MINDLPDILTTENAQLVYVTDTRPGVSRMAKGTGFSYRTAQGNLIHNTEILTRIKKLGIPPAWRQVWICPKPNGHIQATGKDEKGRKQYRYHVDWMAAMQQQKFDRMAFFSEVLPTIRKQIDADMRLPSLQQRRVLATVVWLLEHTFIRVGNTVYARENKHFGLTTLRNRHVSIVGNTISFAFVGKSGKINQVGIAHPRVARTVRQLEELPGYELFQYIDENGRRQPVSSQEVNEYLREIAGEQISAKEFRTWGGTVLAGASLNELGPYATEIEGKKNIVSAIRAVSQHLRNTPAICRSYYIHPLVPESYQNGTLLPYFSQLQANVYEESGELTREEVAIATMLKDQAKAASM